MANMFPSPTADDLRALAALIEADKDIPLPTVAKAINTIADWIATQPQSYEAK